MKKTFAAMLIAAAVLSACGQSGAAEEKKAEAGEGTELYVFAAASMTETMDQIKEKYEAANPGIKIVPT